MEEVFQIVMGILINIVAPAAAGAALYMAGKLLSQLGKYVQAKLEKEQEEAKASGKTARAAMFHFAVTVLNGVVHTVVSGIEARQAYQIREAVKAGEAPYEELQRMSGVAYEEIVRLLDEQVKECLDSCVADTETFIYEKIEELLPGIKAGYLKTLDKGET